MLAVRVLERKEVIRFFGVALMVAPIMNFIVSIAQLQRADKWQSQVLWQAWQLLPLPKKILAGAALVIGIMMLNGSKAAWKYTMVLLAGHLFFQILNFGQSVRESWLAIPAFIVNIGLFLFIADQLVWKQKAPAQGKKPVPVKVSVTAPVKSEVLVQPKVVPIKSSAPKTWAAARKSVRVDFDGFGPWAKLVSFSSKDIVMRSVVNDPPSMEGRFLEVLLPGGALLKARFVKRAGDLFYFEAAKPEAQDVAKINNWLRSQSAA